MFEIELMLIKSSNTWISTNLSALNIICADSFKYKTSNAQKYIIPKRNRMNGVLINRLGSEIKTFREIWLIVLRWHFKKSKSIVKVGERLPSHNTFSLFQKKCHNKISRNVASQHFISNDILVYSTFSVERLAFEIFALLIIVIRDFCPFQNCIRGFVLCILTFYVYTYEILNGNLIHFFKFICFGKYWLHQTWKMTFK